MDEDIRDKVIIQPDVIISVGQEFPQDIDCKDT